MSSTEDKATEALKRFYERRILPLAAHPDTAHLEDPRRVHADSWYHRRERQTMSKADFELRLADPAQAAETLAAHWAGTPLAEITAEMMALSEHFQARDEKSTVSAFIYEMF